MHKSCSIARSMCIKWSWPRVSFKTTLLPRINKFKHIKPISNMGLSTVFWCKHKTHKMAHKIKFMLVKKLAQNLLCASETKFYLYLQSSKICLHMRNGHTPLTMPFWRVGAKPCWKGWCGCHADVCRGGEGGRADGQEIHRLPRFMFFILLLEVLTTCTTQPSYSSTRRTGWKWVIREVQNHPCKQQCYGSVMADLFLSKDDNIWKITNCCKPLYSCFS